jgi:hypothetical protein
MLRLPLALLSWLLVLLCESINVRIAIELPTTRAYAAGSWCGAATTYCSRNTKQLVAARQALWWQDRARSLAQQVVLSKVADAADIDRSAAQLR